MDIEKTLTKSEMIAVLKQLTAALESDQALQIDSQTITIANGATFDLELEHEEGQYELELEFKWPAKEPSTSDSPDQAPHPAGYYEVFLGQNDKWYFHLKSANHQIILVSQGYSSKAAAQKGMESVKVNAQESAFEMRTSKAKQPYFVLKAHNGEIIGTSQMYKRKVGAQKGMRSVITHADGVVRS